ncbi:hypothetical protein A6E05_13640 [Aliivibrio sp. 1S165]|uniref:hypothetical protein n=1 Tax=unclassified Aliivibrio TaxID=2645654 RepID=UPI00080E37E9|nr:MULTISPECIES: hypothetical protein [unclassified Aliivibrio]OCH17757.1 hypothetical protein A6E05_13640 [Aliivibrio sp. 1S165]OCH33798.1 hypothetical protein A6E06_17775 [Aliivibrio sp. 1S175]
MNLFSDELFELIDENPLKGLVDVIKIIDLNLNKSVSSSEGNHEVLWNGCILINDVIETYNLNFFGIPLPEATSSISANCSNLINYLADATDAIKEQETCLNIIEIKNRYAHKLKSTFAYEFSQGDIDRIQHLITELREHISQSTMIEEDHKHRLLKRLEKLQSELHKRVADLDRFWGLVGDAGVVLGKFGNDAKPLVDRIKEIANITWNTQKRAEELPSETRNPMLESQIIDD